MMRISRYVAAAMLAGGLVVTSAAVAQTNEQDRKDVQAQTKQAEKADKAQAKADKSAHKAAKSEKMKKAARDQDKANKEASKVPPTTTPQ
jgi:hypothetical protein